MAWYDSMFGGAPAAPVAPAAAGGGASGASSKDPWWNAFFQAAPVQSTTPAAAPNPMAKYQADVTGPGSRPDMYSFNQAPTTPAPVAQPNPIQDALNFVGAHVLGVKPAAPTPAPTSSQVKMGADLGNMLNLNPQQSGTTTTPAFQKLVSDSAANPAAPPKPPSIIDMLAQGAKDAVGAMVPGSKPFLNEAPGVIKSPAAKGVAMGTGTLAINLLAGLNDPLAQDNTTGDAEDAKLRAANAGNKTAPANNFNPVTGKSVLDDVATGLIDRLTLGKGGAIVKAAQGVGLALFGANIVKDTPAYVQQIMQTQDPAQRFSLGTQLLGSYLLLGHGAKTTADVATGAIKSLPKTQTVPQSVPIDLPSAIEFTRTTNPNLSDLQKQAFQQLYDQGGSAVKEAIKAGSTNVDVTVPTTYGRLISFVQSKIAQHMPLTPAEVKVQAAVASDPGSLVPTPEQLTKDPATLAMVHQAAAEAVTPPTPAVQTPVQPPAPVPGTKTLAQVNIPEVNIQGAPSQVTVPQPTPQAPRGPSGSLGQLHNLVAAAAQAPGPNQFTEALASFNPAQLRGFKTSDGAIVNGQGSAPGKVSVLEPNAKQLTERPLKEVLQDFYYQARNEKPPTEGTETNVGTPKTKSLKNVIRTKADAQAQVNAMQHEANGTVTPKSLKNARVAQVKPPVETAKTDPQHSLISSRPATPADRQQHADIQKEAAGELKQLHKDTGGTHLQRNDSGTGRAKHIQTTSNDKFYRDTFKRTGKPPTAAEYAAEAHRQLMKGSDERSQHYQSLEAKINPHTGPEASDEASMRELTSSIKFKAGDENPKNLRTVKEGAHYLQKTRGSAPFRFTEEPLTGGAAATFNNATKMISAALTPDSKIDIMHVGHEVGHEIFSDVLTDSERTEFAGIIRAEYKGNPAELVHKIVAYNYYDLPEEHQGALDYALAEVGKNEPALLPLGTTNQEPGYNQMTAAYKAYAEKVAEHGQAAIDAAIKQAAPGSGRGLVKFLREAHEQATTSTYSDTVMEEIFSDMNGEYVAKRTGTWSDQLKQWFSDLWNGIKKVAGGNYDKMQEVFKQSYEGMHKDDATKVPADQAPVFTTTKLKLADDESGLWESRFKDEQSTEPSSGLSAAEEAKVWDDFANAAGTVEKEVQSATKISEQEARIQAARDKARNGIPTALGEVPVGDFRALTDNESTPMDDYRHIAANNKPDSAKKIVENYDGLMELRRLKNQERIHELFHGISKEQDQALFDAAKRYQVGGVTNAAHGMTPGLMKVFNGVTKLYDAVGQDAFVSGRIGQLRENYVTQIWDKGNLKDTGLSDAQVAFLRGASSTTTRFSLERIVKTYNDGIALGLKPKYTKLSDLLHEYLQADTRAAAGRFMADDVLALGDKYVVPSANGQPAGWKAINKISGLRGFAVAPEVSKALRPLESISGIRENWLGRTAVKISQTSTQVLMAGDLLLLKNYFFDAPKASWLGAPRLIYEAGQMTPKIRAELITLGGLKMSDHPPEMEQSKLGKFARKVMSETKNPYFWPDYVSFKGGDILRNGTATMIYKGLTDKGMPSAEAAKQAVKFAQDTFGRQNLVRAGRSQTVQDVMRIAMISPDYTESRFKFMGKAFAGATFKIKDAQYRRYTVGFARYMLFAGLFLETLNLAFSGHTTNKNDEDHKWDLEVDGPNGKYYVNVLGAVKTDLRLINGISDAMQGDTSTLVKFIGGKGSTVERVAQMLLTNKDYNGNDVVNQYTDNIVEKFQKLAANVLNTFVPLPFQSQFSNEVGTPAPKGVEGVLFRTLGLDLYNPKSVPTQARQSLTELETDKQNVQMEVYSLVKAGQIGQAQSLINNFNSKLSQVGVTLSKLNNISPTDVQSLQELGTTGAIDSGKLIAKAQSSTPSASPISNLIDYGVGGTTISSNKSTSGQANVKAASLKSAKTRVSKGTGKVRKAKIVKGPRVKSLKTARTKSIKAKRPRLRKA